MEEALRNSLTSNPNNRYVLSNGIRHRLQARGCYYLVSAMLIVSGWFTLRGVYKYLQLWSIQVGAPLPAISVLGEPYESNLYLETFFSFWILICTWLLSTKVKTFQTLRARWLVFGTMLIGVIFQYLWVFSIPISKTFIPFLETRATQFDLTNNTIEAVFLKNFDYVMNLIFAIPLILLAIIGIWLTKVIFLHWGDLLKEFKLWEYSLQIPYLLKVMLSDEKQRKLAAAFQRFFTEKNPRGLPQPDVQLGPNSKTGEMVVIQGESLTLNTMIVGNIGTGKTAALALPIINQVFHYMAKMINSFEELYNRDDYHTENIKGSLINGLSLIEPSNDLCQKTFQLVQAHKIPSSVVYYLDPTNPDTPSINFTRGPVDKVAEMLCSVLTGLDDNGHGNPFFMQAERAHLKQHIYLLKLHDVNKKVLFDDLLDMYNDPNLVHQMNQQLKEQLPKDIESIPDRDERNHWRIAKNVVQWFDLNYIPEVDPRSREAIIITEGKYRGQNKIYDKQEQYVKGLRNTLNDISGNTLMRRILCGDSTFDFDKHLEFGGILLVNTAKGELGGLSDVLGKLCLYAIQNAVFRRKPNVSPYHVVLADEFPDYLYRAFRSFPAQSRKYKVPLIVISQTISQFAMDHGTFFMQTLLGTFRNKLVYGDVTEDDARLFSKLMGTKIVYEEREGDQELDLLSEHVSARKVSMSYSRTEVPILSENDILNQEAFQCAAKVVKNNAPQIGVQVNANFVPRQEFIDATVQVEEGREKYWLQVRGENVQEQPKEELIADTDVDALEQIHEEIQESKVPPAAVITNMERWLETIHASQFETYDVVDEEKKAEALQSTSSISTAALSDNSVIKQPVRREREVLEDYMIPEDEELDSVIEEIEEPVTLMPILQEESGTKIELESEVILEGHPATQEIVTTATETTNKSLDWITSMHNAMRQQEATAQSQQDLVTEAARKEVAAAVQITDEKEDAYSQLFERSNRRKVAGPTDETEVIKNKIMEAVHDVQN